MNLEVITERLKQLLEAVTVETAQKKRKNS